MKLLEGFLEFLTSSETSENIRISLNMTYL